MTGLLWSGWVGAGMNELKQGGDCIGWEGPGCCLNPLSLAKPRLLPMHSLALFPSPLS